MITELIQNLITINNSIEGQDMSFENALSIVKFYDEMPEPNNLIDEAEEMAAYDIGALEKSVIKLKEESYRFLSVGMPMLKEVNFKAIAQNYSHTFYNRYQKAEKELTAYWKTYCQLNNRLDYLVLYSQEYIETEKRCEEAKGECYFSNVHEWRAAIARDYDAFFQKMLGVAKLTDRHYRDIKLALHKILNEQSNTSESPKSQPLFSNLPSGFLSKLTVLRHRLSNRIRNYLIGSFTLPRGWTLLTILLYALLFILLLYLRTTITVSG